MGDVIHNALRDEDGSILSDGPRPLAALDALADPVLLVEWRDGRLVIADLNLAACELTGASRESLRGGEAEALLAPGGGAQLAEAMEEVRRRGRYLFETCMVDSWGREVCFEVHAARNGGRPGGPMLLSCRDVSLRKLVLDALEAAQENYRRMFDMAVKGVFQTTLEGRFIKANPAMASLLGYRSPDRLLLEITDLGGQIYADSGDRERCLSLLRDQGEIRRFETRFLRRDGTEVWVSLTARLVRGQTELDTYIEGFCEDVTEYKLAERALRESEELHRQTLASLGDTVCITRDDGTFTYVSPNCGDVFGMEPHAVHSLGGIGALFGRELFDPADLDRQGELPNLEAVVNGPDGPRSLLVSVKKVDILGGTRLFVCRDVTEHHRLRAEAMRAAHLASLGELAAGVAHEINNPINGIMLYAELLEEQAADLGENADVPERIVRQGERVAAIVRNLLAFSRKSEPTVGAVNAREILDDALALVRARLMRSNVRLELAVPENLPRVRGSDQEVQQVFLNLLTNAHDALNQRFEGRDPDKLLRIGMAEAQGEDGPVLRVEILDHGAGIPAEIMDRVFDPFFSTKPENYGTGLGLSTTHRIVTGLGGRIRFESAEGRYTRAVVELPVWEEG